MPAMAIIPDGHAYHAFSMLGVDIRVQVTDHRGVLPGAPAVPEQFVSR